MTCLDLIVTCDTSIAHLAGALAAPVWVALKSDAEWRWLTGRANSPWYPTMRLFRQSRRGVWSDVFEAMALEVAALAARRAAPRMISTPCSLGELIDKITILRIKAERIREEEKLANVRRELALLERLAREDGPSGPSIDLLTDQPRRRQRAPVDHRRRDSHVRARGRLRAALRRARAIGLLRKRCARSDQTRDQHARQLGSGRGEELRLTGLSRGPRSSVARARTGRLGLSASAGAASCSRTPIVAPRRQMSLASRTSPVSSICTASRGGSPMSRASVRRSPSRDRSHIRPSQTKRYDPSRSLAERRRAGSRGLAR